MENIKNKSLQELYSLLDENDVREIIKKMLDIDDKKMKDWKIEKMKDYFEIHLSELENTEKHSNNSIVIILTDTLDIYQQSCEFKGPQFRVPNLFKTYEFMSELLSQKLKIIKAKLEK